MIDQDFQKKVEDAYRRIQKDIRFTPLQFSPSLSESSNAEVYLKLENFQVTGSFKARGATNKLKILHDQGHKKIVTASSGNHGSAVANAAKILSVNALIFLPKTVSDAKLKKIKFFGAEIKLVSGDSGDAEVAARNYAQENNLIYLSPYNDIDVIAGQGTIGIEILKEQKSMDAIFIAVGGGGLISGVGSYLKQVNPNCEVIACSPENSAAMHHALEKGKIETIKHLQTLSDGTAGALEEGSVTFDFCKSVVSQSLLVSEKEISYAMKNFIDHHQMLIEGAAGVALAGFENVKKEFKNKKVTILLCGGNISNQTLMGVLQS
jgi:threonine dehydratase